MCVCTCSANILATCDQLSCGDDCMVEWDLMGRCDANQTCCLGACNLGCDDGKLFQLFWRFLVETIYYTFRFRRLNDIY